jgi:hypothetical protein
MEEIQANLEEVKQHEREARQLLTKHQAKPKPKRQTKSLSKT